MAEASRRQREASDPQSSAWVSANAGSGKTHVLAQRVIRLLLAGAEPSKLLCLTFTKAAAANMADRVFDRLAAWTRLDDKQLAADILALGAMQPTRADLERARKLFARVIETPGGLKIQTLHAFCERVLHLFPFEANVPAGFRPLDERAAALIREQAQARLFADADAELGEAIARVAGLVSVEAFAPLVAETARLGEALTVHGTPEAFAAKLAERLGLDPGEDEASIVQEMRGGGPAIWRAWARALQQGSAADQKTAAILSGAAATTDPDSRLDVYLQAFFTKELTPRKTLATKATTDRCPDIVEALYAERERLAALLDKRRAAAAVARSRDLYRLSLACENAYKRAKAARAALDFDDLIAKTEALFEQRRRRLGALQARQRHRAYSRRRSARHFARAVGNPGQARRGFLERRRRGVGRAHFLRGRRRETVDLLVPGRGAASVRGDAPLFRAPPRARGARLRVRAVEPFVPLGARYPRRRRQSVRGRGRLERRERGRAEGAAAFPHPRKPAWRRRNLAAAGRRPAPRARRLGGCRSTRKRAPIPPSRSPTASPASSRSGWRRARRSASPIPRPARCGRSGLATSSSWCARADRFSRR